MKKLFVENIVRIIRNRNRLEEKLEVRIENRGKEVYIDGNPEDEFIAEKVIEALDFGFPFSVAMLIKEEDYEFQIINIKEHAISKNFERVRGRIIGRQGKCFRTLCELTKCFFELKDNSIGIIGEPEEIENAENAMICLIRGTKHANVYSYLEKCRQKPILDLGLKKVKKRTSTKE